MRFYIRGRKLWRARKPKSITRSDWGRKMTIIVHHAADHGPKSNKPKHEREYMRGLQDFHMGPSRGWSDIAYNYVIMPSGRVYEGRGFGKVGAHAPGWNTRGIGICFAGDGSHAPTKAAVLAYHKLNARLRKKGAHIRGVRPHSDVYATSCPGDGIRKALGL